MKKEYYIGIIVVILLGLGGFFFFGGNNQLEAPTDVSNETSAITAEGEVSLEGDMIEDVEGIKSFTVTGKNFTFDPETITVKKGDRVRVTFVNSEGFHDFIIDEFGAATKQLRSPGTEVIEFTADKAGSFEYYCSVGSHRQMGMKGTLIVEE